MGVANAGYSVACVTKLFPTRSHTIAAQVRHKAQIQRNRPIFFRVEWMLPLATLPMTIGGGTCMTLWRFLDEQRCLFLKKNIVVQGSDWLGDQDSIEYMCREAPTLISELAEMGLPFSRTPEGCANFSESEPFHELNANFSFFPRFFILSFAIFLSFN